MNLQLHILTIFQYHTYLLHSNMYVFYHFYLLEASNIFNYIWNLTKKSFGITGLVITNGSLQYNALDWSLVNYSTDWIQNTLFKNLTLTFLEYHS
jgi:hypothetical protein